MRAHVASLVLLGTFTYHMASEMVAMVTQPGYAVTGGYMIIRAGFFGAVGLIAAGAFRQEIDAKAVLEELVEERTAQIVQQADELRMVGLALKASETAIAITDQQRNIIWLNPALRRLTGKKETALLNTSLAVALSPSEEDTEKLIRCFNETVSLEDEILVNGKIMYAQVSPSTDAEFQNSGSRFVVVLKDITEKRALERAKKSAQQEALISQAMSESMEVLTHELRTPLQGIMGMTSLILDNNGYNLPTDAKESLSLVMICSKLLLTLINNILDVRKCDANMMNDFQLSAVPAAPPLTDAVDFCRPLAAVSSIKLDLVFDGTSETAIVMSDSLRIQQVGINLISNAIKYSPTGSYVRIRTKIMTLEEVEAIMKEALAVGPHQTAWDSDDNTTTKSEMKVLVVSVRDEGQGIDEREKSRMFKKFSQLEESKQRPGHSTVGQPSGTGLGLNLCLKFIHRMKGNIWAANNKSGQEGSTPCGSCFSFYLPLYEVKLEDSSSSLREELLQTSFLDPTASPRKRPVIGVALADYTGLLAPYCNDPSKLRVLVVDDTLINLKVLDRMLKRIGVGTIELAGSGEKALEILANDDYDLVISDIQMPGGISGTELSVAIRDGDMAKKPVVVGLTAEVSQSLDRRCSASGMACVLHKPMTTEQLQDFFKKLLSDGHTEHPDEALSTRDPQI
jgi:PAS domain S-box-containing protein